MILVRGFVPQNLLVVAERERRQMPGDRGFLADARAPRRTTDSFTLQKSLVVPLMNTGVGEGFLVDDLSLLVIN
jgi:hypothetical protein